MAGPNLFQRLGAATKAFRMTFGGNASGRGFVDANWGYPFIPTVSDAAMDARYARPGMQPDLDQNAVVAICLGKILDNFPEPKLEVAKREADGTVNAVPDHPLTLLLERPNDFDSRSGLLGVTALAVAATGTGYWLKTAVSALGPVELEWVSTHALRPLPSKDPYKRIDGYAYRVGGQERFVEAQDVIPFRKGKDPRNPLMGWCALKSCLTSVMTDDEADAYSLAILRNKGVIGGVLTYEDDELEPDTEAIAKLRAQHEAMFTGGGRGRLLIPNFKAKYTEVGGSPEAMALDKIRQVPEARICAALGVPAMVAGLSVGENQRTYANYAEAREAFYEDCLLPMQTLFADALTRYLLPDFGNPTGLLVRWNYDDVKVLQPDQDKLSARTREEFKAKLITRNEGREKLGENPLEEQDPRGGEFWTGPAGGGFGGGDPNAEPGPGGEVPPELVGANGKGH